MKLHDFSMSVNHDPIPSAAQRVMCNEHCLHLQMSAFVAKQNHIHVVLQIVFTSSDYFSKTTDKAQAHWNTLMVQYLYLGGLIIGFFLFQI